MEEMFYFLMEEPHSYSRGKQLTELPPQHELASDSSISIAPYPRFYSAITPNKRPDTTHEGFARQEKIKASQGRLLDPFSPL
jgi:hypothetical protein